VVRSRLFEKKCINGSSVPLAVELSCNYEPG